MSTARIISAEQKQNADSEKIYPFDEMLPSAPPLTPRDADTDTDTETDEDEIVRPSPDFLIHSISLTSSIVYLLFHHPIPLPWQAVGGILNNPLHFPNLSIITLPTQCAFVNHPPRAIVLFDVDDTLRRGEDGTLINEADIQYFLRSAKENNILVGICTTRYYDNETNYYYQHTVEGVVTTLGAEYFSYIIFTNSQNKYHALQHIASKHCIPRQYVTLVDDKIEQNVYPCQQRGFHAIDASEAANGNRAYLDGLWRFFNSVPKDPPVPTRPCSAPPTETRPRIK